jgi:hypothetical protein
MNGNHRQPNQLNVFEQVNINRKGASTNCLRMTQYQGQHTFINCTFLAPFGRKNAIGGTNVHIKNPGGAVVSFINCTFQEAEYGVDMEHASNITFDNCWFENLYKSVEMKNCQNVNIINSRFANACGYGGPQINPYKVNNGDYGYCMGCTATSLNVERNYVLVSRPNTREAQLPYFIVGKSNRANDEFTNHNAIVMRNNNFQHPGLERSKGIAPDLRIESAELTLTHQKAVNVVLPETGQSSLERINSSIGHGEMVVVRLLETEYNSQSTLVISDRDLARSGNLLLGPDEKEIVLAPGNILTFLRVEGWENDGNDLYQLISIN